MANEYRALTRTYRPLSFDDIVSQEHVSSTLKNAITSNRLSHAYMFCGPRGVGKTTMARVLAREINQIDRSVDGESLTQTLNIVEIDAASHNKVDDIHQLRESVRVPPQNGRYKVFIIDEVHMLSKAAFNALLKTLEEPPPHAIFIFATTEPHKVLPTILSRVQRFDFKRISVEEIVEHLREIASRESITVDPESLHLLARKADGALRDALGLMDQAIAFCGNNIDHQELLKALNTVGSDQLFALTENILQKDRSAGLFMVQNLLREGIDLQEFLVSLTEHFRNLYVAVQSSRLSLIDATPDTRELYKKTASSFSEEDLLRMMHLVGEAQIRIRDVQQPRVHFEMLILKLMHMHRSSELGALLQELKSVKKNGSSDWESLNSASESGDSGTSPETKGLKAEKSAVEPKGVETEKSSMEPKGEEVQNVQEVQKGVRVDGPAGGDDIEGGNEGNGDSGDVHMDGEGVNDIKGSTASAGNVDSTNTDNTEVAESSGEVEGSGIAEGAGVTGTGDTGSTGTGSEEDVDDVTTGGSESGSVSQDPHLASNVDDIFDVKPTLGFAKGISSKKLSPRSQETTFKPDKASNPSQTKPSKLDASNASGASDSGSGSSSDPGSDSGSSSDSGTSGGNSSDNGDASTSAGSKTNVETEQGLTTDALADTRRDATINAVSNERIPTNAGSNEPDLNSTEPTETSHGAPGSGLATGVLTGTEPRNTTVLPTAAEVAAFDINPNPKTNGTSMGADDSAADPDEADASTLKEAKKNWGYVLDIVQQEGPDIFFFQIQRVNVLSAKDQILTVAIDNEFSRKMILENKDRLTTLYSRVSGTRLRLECVVENQKRREETIHPYEKFKELQKKDPLLKDLVDLFGAELDYD